MTLDATPSRVGELVGGKYRVTRFLAEGGMGLVYEAHHAVVKRRFAIKFLRADLSQRRDILTRFQREAEAAGALENENIAATIDFGILTNGSPYIVMEYLAGESLAALLKREGRLPVERAADICAQTCRGMAAAHASGIVHRDLKPDNVFVCRRDDGTDLVKVLDFGVAKLEQVEGADAATRTGNILGTPAYMSPEQARGEATIDQRADVYGLAAILFEMLSAQTPHPGNSRHAILHHIATQPALSLESLRPGLPAALVAMVRDALASDPRQRPSSAGALGQALSALAKRLVWPAAPEPAPPAGDGPTAAPAAPTVAAPSGVVANKAQAARRTRWAWGVGVALAVVVVIVLFVSTTRRASRLRRASRTDHGLAKGTRFFVPPPNPGAVQQIAALIKAQSFTDAALLTAMQAAPQAVWLTGGTPEDVRAAVQNTIVRATRDPRTPIFVAHNIPFRDCAQYSAGGVPDAAAYAAWITGLAAGIGNAAAVIVLEPDSLGIVPYGTSLDGGADWCKPTVSDASGRAMPAPGATPAERYAQLNDAVERLAQSAPNAAVYLDGTHAGWLNVGEAASRLVQAGVRRAQGFIVNIANFQPTAQSIQYATWISKCIHYATNTEGGRRPGRYVDCASQYAPASPRDYATWARSDAWYAENVDRGPGAPTGTLTHFVIDTSRSGRGAMDATHFAAPPYNQPPEVVAALARGIWCNPPGIGIGPLPTVATGYPLCDAFLWVKRPGESDGSCDIAGGARAWDYDRYNPWGISGDARNHFDPLWGMVDPTVGTWFPEQALQLAQNASPPVPAEHGAAAIVPAAPTSNAP